MFDVVESESFFFLQQHKICPIPKQNICIYVGLSVELILLIFLLVLNGDSCVEDKEVKRFSAIA